MADLKFINLETWSVDVKEIKQKRYATPRINKAAEQ